jgi:hypothetical protein
MTNTGADLAVTGSEKRRMTHAGIPTGSVRSDCFYRYRYRKNPAASIYEPLGLRGSSVHELED